MEGILSTGKPSFMCCALSSSPSWHVIPLVQCTDIRLLENLQLELLISASPQLLQGSSCAIVLCLGGLDPVINAVLDFACVHILNLACDKQDFELIGEGASS